MVKTGDTRICPLDLLLEKYLHLLGGDTATVASPGLDNSACCLVKVNAGIGLSP